MWKRLVVIAAGGALLDWVTTSIGLSTGLCYETHPYYNPFIALTLFVSLSLIAYKLRQFCSYRLRFAYTVLAFAISASGYFAAINNAIVILQLPR